LPYARAKDTLLLWKELPPKSSEVRTLPIQLKTATLKYKDANGDYRSTDCLRGEPPQLTIGTVTTLDESAEATATITGTTAEPQLNLGIPRGRAGLLLEGYELSYDATSGTLSTVERSTPTTTAILEGYALNYNESAATLSIVALGG